MYLLLPRTSLCLHALLCNTPLLGAVLQNGSFVGWSQQHCHTRGCSRALPGAVYSGLLLLSLLIMLFWNTSRVWVLDAANPTLVFMFFDKSYVIALQMYWRKAADDLCCPHEGILIALLFKKCSLSDLLMCSSSIYGESSGHCTVTVVIGLRDSPAGLCCAVLSLASCCCVALRPQDFSSLGTQGVWGWEGWPWLSFQLSTASKACSHTATFYLEPLMTLSCGDLSELGFGGWFLPYMLCSLYLCSWCAGQQRGRCSLPSLVVLCGRGYHKPLLEVHGSKLIKSKLLKWRKNDAVLRK